MVSSGSAGLVCIGLIDCYALRKCMWNPTDCPCRLIGEMRIFIIESTLFLLRRKREFRIFVSENKNLKVWKAVSVK